MAHHPQCLQDGKFLANFYVAHSADERYNSLNQRYWLQYHSANDISSPSTATKPHLIRPSDTSAQYARAHGLLPFRQWVNLTHESTYIHGPFDLLLSQIKNTSIITHHPNSIFLHFPFTSTKVLLICSLPSTLHISHLLIFDQIEHIVPLAKGFGVLSNPPSPLEVSFFPPVGVISVTLVCIYERRIRRRNIVVSPVSSSFGSFRSSPATSFLFLTRFCLVNLFWVT